MAIQIKIILADDFLKQNGVKKEDLYEDIKKQIKELKDSYDDDLTKDYKDKDHELAWMFLVDGCAILQFMYTDVNFQANRDTQNWRIETYYKVFLTEDLFCWKTNFPTNSSSS